MVPRHARAVRQRTTPLRRGGFPRASNAAPRPRLGFVLASGARYAPPPVIISITHKASPTLAFLASRCRLRVHRTRGALPWPGLGLVRACLARRAESPVWSAVPRQARAVGTPRRRGRPSRARLTRSRPSRSLVLPCETNVARLTPPWQTTRQAYRRVPCIARAVRLRRAPRR